MGFLVDSANVRDRAPTAKRERRTAVFAALLICIALLTACGGGAKRRQARVPEPPPPAGESTTTKILYPPSWSKPPAPSAPEAVERVNPIYVEEGMASWYGAPYHNRKAANGETYDMNAMTAAHLTLPLNSIARVTNLKTGRAAVVRITDRGPFVENRVIDLSVAAAKALDIWRPGTARVRIEVLEAPSSIDRGGRWAVQLGGFEQKEAERIKAKLAERYREAKVIDFSSPVGDWWVRVRVPHDDKTSAQEVARNTPAPLKNTFLVRLD